MAGLPPYNFEDYLEMFLIYGECQRNARLASRTFAERFPNRPHPDHRVILNALARFLERGTVVPQNAPVRNPDPGPREQRERGAARRIDVLRRIEENPHTSSRAIGSDVHCSHTQVLRILHSGSFHPYKIHLHQHFKPQDYGPRAHFCTWVLNQIEQDGEFLRHVLTSDECTFRRDGTVNRHNVHYWSRENPHWLRPHHHQENWRINVWCGLLGDRVIGPVFLEETLNGERYVNLLNTVVSDTLDDLPLAERARVWYQHDGAPPHFARVSRDWLDAEFGPRWIGRGGPVAWPPRSPDLTPLDFFFWGYVQSIVYATEPVTLDDLRDRIRQAAALVSPDMLASARENWAFRCRQCMNVDGRHFEHLR